jgi:hypothetical protein
VTEFNLPEGTFFDTAVVHILTKATLDRLHELYLSREAASLRLLQLEHLVA